MFSARSIKLFLISLILPVLLSCDGGVVLVISDLTGVWYGYWQSSTDPDSDVGPLCIELVQQERYLYGNAYLRGLKVTSEGTVSGDTVDMEIGGWWFGSGNIYTDSISGTYTEGALRGRWKIVRTPWQDCSLADEILTSAFYENIVNGGYHLLFPNENIVNLINSFIPQYQDIPRISVLLDGWSSTWPVLFWDIRDEVAGESFVLMSLLDDDYDFVSQTGYGTVLYASPAWTLDLAAGLDDDCLFCNGGGDAYVFFYYTASLERAWQSNYEPLNENYPDLFFYYDRQIGDLLWSSPCYLGIQWRVYETTAWIELDFIGNDIIYDIDFSAEFQIPYTPISGFYIYHGQCL